ncbi:MAG: cation transporter [Campylobacter sp.]|nr:cation transporter [Campylobacter sp.]
MQEFLAHEPLFQKAKHCEHSHEHNHNHSHTHEHNHTDARFMDKKILKISLILTSAMIIVQFIYSLLSNSLALLSDTLHMFWDALSLVFSLLAIIAIQKWQNSQKTFGYFRLEILVAFVNALTIIASAIFIIYEGIFKLFEPQSIDAKTMIIVAFIGLLVNAFCAFLMFKGANLDNINIKSAFLHLMSDLFGSVCVIIGGIFVYFTNIVYIDTILAIILSFLLIRYALKLLKQSVNILLESSPVNIEEVKNVILEDKEILEIKDLHITQITHRMLVATMHIVIKDLNDFEVLAQRLSKRLLEQFEIGHLTIQPQRS